MSERGDRRKARAWQLPHTGTFGAFIVRSSDEGPYVQVTGGTSLIMRKHPLTGATAVLEASLAQGSRTTAGRVVAGTLLAGPFGAVIGAVAKKDVGKLYVTVTLADGTELKDEFKNKDEARARKLVDNVNAFGSDPRSALAAAGTEPDET